MRVHNIEIAEKFTKLANLLEIEGANPFRVRAYRNAARTIATLGQETADLIAKDEDLTSLPGIGDDLADKIKTIVKTGELPILKQIQSRLPAVLNELMNIEGLGPRRIQILYKKLKIKNLRDLKQKIKAGRVRDLKGFGKKTEQKILEGIIHREQYTRRFLLKDVFPLIDSLKHYLKSIKEIKKIECAGSFRRCKETVGDLDFLIVSDHNKKAMDHFLKFDEVDKIISKGTTRSTVRLHSGIQVDLRVVPLKSYGAALLYFTGSKEHNISVRKMAVKKKLKINEYGVFKNNKQIAGKSEKSVYQTIGLSYIEPELRENRGEIEAAKSNKLPHLIELSDIRGDLHCHTDASDGEESIQEMAKAAASLGYEYIAITDHSKKLAMTNGLNKKKLFEQIKLIDKMNAKLKNITLLKSCEVDILEDGTLDLPDDVLKELDFTICSIHSKFNLSEKKQTERVQRAMENPYFIIFSHPTGRLIQSRKPYAIDLQKIIETAKENDCILELNAQPNRLDLNDIYCKMAKENGVKIAISSDAHAAMQFKNMKFGILQARRGWLEKKDVINTLPLTVLKKLLKR